MPIPSGWPKRVPVYDYDFAPARYIWAIPDPGDPTCVREVELKDEPEIVEVVK